MSDNSLFDEINLRQYLMDSGVSDVEHMSVEDMIGIASALRNDTDGIREDSPAPVRVPKSEREREDPADPRHWSIGELTEVLIAHGFSDARSLSVQEMVNCVVALTGYDDSQGSSTLATDIPTASVSQQEPNAPVTTSLNIGQPISPQISQPSTGQQMETGVELNSEQAIILAEFCGITGASIDAGTHYLEAMDWSLATAVEMYLQHAGDDAAATSFTPAFGTDMSAPIPNPIPVITHPIFPDVDQMRRDMDAQLEESVMTHSSSQPSYASVATRMPGFGGMYSQYRSHVDDHNDMFGGMGSDEYYVPTPSPQPHADVYDEEGVRAPDAVRQSRLIGGRGADMSHVLSRAEDESVRWMFPPPNHLSFPGSFQEARTLGKQELKWMLVNIQLHTEFTSQMLNRDTWTDEFLVSVMRSNLVFWQRGHTSGDGQDYMRRYTLSLDTLPRIAIVDPRTGAEIITIVGYVPPQELTRIVLEFLDSNSFDSAVAPRTRHIDMRKDASSGSSSTADKAEATVVEEEEEYVYMDTDDMDAAVDEAAEMKETADGNSSDVVAVPSAPVMRWDAPPEEPAVGGPDVTRVSLKLVNGKTVVRRFLKTDSVEALFRFAASQPIEDVQSRTFDIVTTFPMKSLMNTLSRSLEDECLLNSQVVMRWSD